jgi:predicted nucleotidyltransferase
MKKIPKKFLSSKYRKEMWGKSEKILKKIARVIPIKSAYLVGSFTTKKKRPADVDFIILIKTKDKTKGSKWSVDFQIAPDNKFGSFVVKDVKKWMKQKFGDGKFEFLKIK